MALNPLHELHKRRHGRNIGLGLVLVSLIAIIFGLTMVKITNGEYGQTPQSAQQTEGQNG